MIKKQMLKNISKLSELSVKSAPKSAKSLRAFIRAWNFPDPDWSTLPPNFPNCDTSGLEKEEKHLFGAIVFAWTVSVGKPVFYKNLLKQSLFAVGITLILLLGYNSLSNPESTFSKAVNAATVSATMRYNQIQVQDILESTASALFKVGK